MVSSADADRIHERLDELFREMRVAFHGDGSDGRPGIIVRLDRIEQDAKSRRESRTIAVKAFWTAVSTAAISALMWALHFIAGATKP